MAGFIGCAIGVIASNYIYQMTLSPSPDWLVATERSFFQAIAFIAMGVVLSLREIGS